MTGILNDNWICKIDNEYTFCGVLNEFFDDIARNNYWRKPSTQKQYLSYYNRKILPNIKSHDTKPIREYSKEDFKETIESIRNNGKNRMGEPFKAYDESTLEKMKHLIYAVVVYASEIGLCPNVLRGTSFVTKYQSDSDYCMKKKELFAVKKSFNYNEEKKIAKLLFEDPQCTGEKIGLLLMYCFGLRNAESCAVKFGDFHIINTKTGDMNLYIYESVIIDSNELKAGGKTKNMARILPVPTRMADFFYKRKEYVKSIVDKSENIDSLPFVCAGRNFHKRSKADDLTAEAHVLFKKIGIHEEVLRCIDNDMENSDVKVVLNEKSPTAYLFRRNFATHLHILGLDDAEIRYVIGHSIEDVYETRNGFANKDKLMIIREKMKFRPLVNYEPESCPLITVKNNDLVKFDSSFRIHSHAKPLNVVLTTNEAFGRLEIVDMPDCIITPLQISRTPKRNINVLKKYISCYQIHKKL